MNTKKSSSYRECEKYMYSRLPMFQRQGVSAYKKDLTNTLTLCAKLGNPQDKIKTIHIAGTNGKGTTSHIVAAGLQAQGYKVGVYTSPHYKEFRERIKINGEYISKKYILHFINNMMDSLEVIQPSFFEMTVAMAFSYFADKKVDFAVIETGLGGRLDSTNVIHPILSVITNISFDHQNLLGNTLIEIAAEKAGIIKPDTEVIIGERQENIQNVFIKKAHTEHANIFFADDHVHIIQKNNHKTGYMTIDIFIDGKCWMKDLTTDLFGPFQNKNIKTGFYTLYRLSKILKISSHKIKRDFPLMKSLTKYMGRWQVLSEKPTILADSAHNEGGLKIVLEAIKNQSYKRIHFVLGFVNDKELDKILSLFPADAEYYFVKANIPRGLDATSLQKMAQSVQLNGKSYSSVRKGLAAARVRAESHDLIYVGGSIFVVAEVI